MAQMRMRWSGRPGVSVLVVCLGILVGTLPAGAAENLKLAHQFAPDSLPGKSAAKFAELVAEKSKGAVKVTVLPGGALGDERANLQQLENGSLDLALTGDLVISFMAKPYMLVSMPFIYRDPDHSVAVFNGEIGAEIGKYLLDHNKIRALAWQYAGTRVLTANRPVRTLDDLKGLKLRMPAAEMWVKTWQKTGAVIVNVAFTELYMALQTGTVQAQENPPNFIIAQKFNEVQKYLMPTNHVPQMNVYFLSDAKSRALSAADRAAIEAAAREATDWTTKTAKESQAKDVEWLTSKGGMTLVPIDLTGIQELIKNVPSEVLGAAGPALYDRIRAVR
jgi:tripartite ATP-independent transporter DctP family solute receptor